METYSSNRFAIKGKTARTRVYKNHLKMVQGCRIDTGLCKKPLSKRDYPKHLEQGQVKLQNRYRARWAKGKTGIGLDEHRATHA